MNPQGVLYVVVAQKFRGRGRGWGIFRSAEIPNGWDAKLLWGKKKRNHKTHATGGTVII